MSIRDLIVPFEAVLVSIFFVLMGIQVKLEMFFDMHILLMATALLIVAIVGKLASGIGFRTKGNRWIVGVGMVPRGEVGLIFASIGKGFGVINDALFAAIVLMVIVTTLLAPFVLRWMIGRADGAQEKLA